MAFGTPLATIPQKHSAANGNHLSEKLFVLIEHRMPPNLSFSCARTFGQMPKPSFWIWNMHPYVSNTFNCAHRIPKATFDWFHVTKNARKGSIVLFGSIFWWRRDLLWWTNREVFGDDWYNTWLQKVMEYIYPHVLSHGEMDACCYTTQPHVHFF